jgi:HD superfamily phosphodiesterase
MDVDVAPPDTPAARAALAVATQYLDPALLHHSIRTWYFALGFAEVDGIGPVDDELLYVGALLHDIALADVFDSHRIGYEVAAGAGWTRERRDHLAAAIVAHNLATPLPEGGPEGLLLDIATGLDISGSRPDALPEEYLAAVLDRYPRLDLAERFSALLTAQADRKPGSEAERLVRLGTPAKLAAHPLDGLRA